VSQVVVRAQVVGPAPWAPLAAIVAVGFGGAAIVASMVMPLALVLLAASTMLTVGFAYAWRRSLRGLREVSADAASLRVLGGPQYPRDDLRGLVLDSTGFRAPDVRVEGAGGSLRLLLRMGEEDAVRLAEALALPAPGATYSGGSGVAARMTLAMVFVFVAMMALGAAGSVLFRLPLNGFSVLFPLALVALSRSFRVVVDPQGVTEVSPTRRRRHRWAEIADVERTAKEIVLRRHDGRRVALTIAPLVSGEGRRGLVDAAFARAKAGLERHESGGVGTDVRALLDPSQSEPRAWIARLRELATDGYRASRPADEELWRLVEDGAEADVHRSAAALVLGRQLDEQGRKRMRRIAVAGDAETPKLRIALSAAAEGDVEAAEEAAAELAGARRRSRLRERDGDR